MDSNLEYVSSPIDPGFDTLSVAKIPANVLRINVSEFQLLCIAISLKGVKYPFSIA